MNDLSGQSLGRYHLIEKLGEGGMAVVYKAFDTRLECDVAVKLIRMEELPQSKVQQALTRFEREAKAVAQLNHPNIVNVTDYGEQDGLPYLVMKYLPGGTLKSLMHRRGKVSWQEAVALLTPIASALEYAHGHNIIHRDVKPANILMTESGQPMLTDFGIAKVLDLEGAQAGLTGTGMTIGTPEYMAPEQWEGKAVDARADIYAFGVVFYEMVTGRPPFKADTVPGTMTQVLRDPLPRPSNFTPGLPPLVEQFLFKALARNPEERYKTTSEMIAVLQQMIKMGEGGFPQPGVYDQTFGTYYEGNNTYNSRVTNVQGAVPPPPVYPGYQPPYPPPQANPPKSKWWIGLIVGAAVVVVAGVILMIIKPWENTSGRIVANPTDTPQSFVETAAATEAPIPAATEAPVGRQKEELGVGSIQISKEDDARMVYVPAGNFLMGSPEGVGDADENPQHTVYLDAYWIDETEVTNSMYQKCVSTGFCTEPSDKSSYTRPSYYGNPDYANYPVIYVNWNQAAQYCSWAKRRLPTEAQWEKAARGENGLIYPWGNESPTGNLVNFADASSNLSFADNSINDGFADTSPVGSFPQGASPYGALNMAGNVWEWVADFYSDSYYFESSNGGSSIISNPFGPGSGDQYVFRGGSWYSTIRLLRTANRNWDIPTQVFHNLGFRCAMPAN